MTEAIDHAAEEEEAVQFGRKVFVAIDVGTLTLSMAIGSVPVDDVVCATKPDLAEVARCIGNLKSVVSSKAHSSHCSSSLRATREMKPGLKRGNFETRWLVDKRARTFVFQINQINRNDDEEEETSNQGEEAKVAEKAKEPDLLEVAISTRKKIMEVARSVVAPPALVEGVKKYNIIDMFPDHDIYNGSILKRVFTEVADASRRANLPTSSFTTPKQVMDAMDQIDQVTKDVEGQGSMRRDSVSGVVCEGLPAPLANEDDDDDDSTDDLSPLVSILGARHTFMNTVRVKESRAKCGTTKRTSPFDNAMRINLWIKTAVDEIARVASERYMGEGNKDPEHIHVQVCFAIEQQVNTSPVNLSVAMSIMSLFKDMSFNPRTVMTPNGCKVTLSVDTVDIIPSSAKYNYLSVPFDKDSGEFVEWASNGRKRKGTNEPMLDKSRLNKLFSEFVMISRLRSMEWKNIITKSAKNDFVKMANSDNSEDKMDDISDATNMLIYMMNIATNFRLSHMDTFCVHSFPPPVPS
jgi:hypothetical protein